MEHNIRNKAFGMVIFFLDLFKWKTYTKLGKTEGNVGKEPSKTTKNFYEKIYCVYFQTTAG
jgi:hypothetical protein